MSDYWEDPQDYRDLYNPSINDGWDDIEKCAYCGTQLYDSDGDLICPNSCEGEDES